MVTFSCNKLGRDKGLEGFKKEGITPRYKILGGKELCNALLLKLIEEAAEVRTATDQQEIIAELADVLEVVDGLCKAYSISLSEIKQIKEEKYKPRGGFEQGLYIETLQMDESNPKVDYFRASPDKYPEI